MTGKYLARYAEAETGLVQSLPGRWRHAVVIPAYRESGEFLQHSLPDHCLLITVINRPANDPKTRWATELLAILGTSQWRNQHLSLHNNVLAVDRCVAGQPLPPKQGVGLARKIGADIASQLIDQGTLSSSWFGSSDADARLPEGYARALSELPENAAACVFPFRHQPAGVPQWVVSAYENHMLYYVAGLRFAQSPYAWPTIGSCLAINSDAYMKVRGFPKRAGGEDFYLLNKLAKLGGIIHRSEPLIDLEGRCSDRVPFGTGPALGKIAALTSPEDYASYNPESFVLLRAFLAALREASEQESGPTDSAVKNRATPGELQTLWLAFDCDAAIQRARQNSTSGAQRLRQLMTWFDAFRTLKFIHRCREFYPDISLPYTLAHTAWLQPVVTRSAAHAKEPVVSQTVLLDNLRRGV